MELRPEPTNRYDAHALVVMINGRQGGYIGSGTALQLQPAVVRANQMGYVIQVTGTFDIIHDDMVVRMTLPWGRELNRWLDCPPEQRAAGYVTIPAKPEGQVWLKRSGDFQEALGHILGNNAQTTVTAVLSSETTPRGKYAGQNLIRATVDGQTIGLIPAQYREQTAHIFEAVEGGTTYGVARVERRDDGRLLAGVRTDSPPGQT